MATTTFHGFKGGTGKSLLAVTHAYYLNRQGKKVLAIDGDYRAPCFEAFFPRKDVEMVVANFKVRDARCHSLFVD